jgi:hypothetical protein
MLKQVQHDRGVFSMREEGFSMREEGFSRTERGSAGQRGVQDDS